MIYVIVYQISENEGAAKVIGYTEDLDAAQRFCRTLQEHSYGQYTVHEAELI
jgi:hypothetical protein